MKNYNGELLFKSTLGSIDALRLFQWKKQRVQQNAFRLCLLTIAAVLVASCASVPKKPTASEQAAIQYDYILLPIKKDNDKGDFYPVDALRMGRAGCVSLAYSIDAQGKPVNISVILSDYKELDLDAKTKLAAYQFEVPPDWIDSGGLSRRYRLGFMYVLEGKAQPVASDGNERQIVITARRVRTR